MFGEAIVIFNPALAQDLKYIRKQGMQLHSKMRFIGAQFDALLSHDLWKRCAQHANEMAQKLQHELKKIPSIRITQPVEANGIFAIMPAKMIQELQKAFFFYIWNDKTSEVRLMCSFDTTEEDVMKFSKRIQELA